jgi:hypothetical protein
MHNMGFKVANSYQELTRKQRMFFNYAYLYQQKCLYGNKDEEKDKVKSIVERNRNG